MNGKKYLADEHGIRESGTGSYWAYSDTISWYITSHYTENGITWVFAKKYYESLSSVRIFKFDGGSIVEYTSISNQFEGFWEEAVSIGNLLFFTSGLTSNLVCTFDKATGIFDVESPTYFQSIPMLPIGISKGADNTLMAVGGQNDSLFVFEWLGSDWSSPTFLMSPIDQFNYGILFTSVGSKLLVTMQEDNGGFLFDKVGNSYVPVDTIYHIVPLLFSSRSRHDTEGNLYVMAPYLDSFGPCSDTNIIYIKFVNDLVGVDNPAEPSLKLYPNPAAKHLELEIQNANVKSITILNLLGQQVYFENIHQGKLLVDIEQIPKGLYLLKVATYDGATIQKFLKQ